MLLLVDKSLEIPPFLLRNKDNTFKYPPGSLAHPDVDPPPVTAEVTSHEAKMAEGRQKDEAARREILASEAARSHMKFVVIAQKQKEKREEQALDKVRKSVIKGAQRQVFMQHFKWSFENENLSSGPDAGHS